MKASTRQLQTLIKNSSTVKAVPKLIAEWEHNRFSPLNPVTVTPTQDIDTEWASIYDLQSITNPNRPQTGIAKARFSSKLIVSSSFKDSPTSSRFYMSTDADTYKYFSTTQKSAATATGGEYLFSAPIVITSTYVNQVVANKLIIGFEQSYAKPKRFTVEVSSNGTTWTSVSGVWTPDATGKLVLWRDSVGNWNNTPRYDGPAALKGIRITVYSMDAASAHLDLIQMGLSLEDDLSDFVESNDKSMEISDRSLIAPVGRASSNTGTVTLSNIDGRFNNENESSLYFGLLGKKVRFRLDMSFDVTSTGGSSDERIRELTMWTDSWGSQEETSVTVNLVDSSVILQEIPMPRVFWTDLTYGAIIWQTMDIIGLTNYNYTKDVLDSGQMVPFFYPEKDKTVWDTFSDLSEGTQNAIYFDEYDMLQIKTRKSLFSANKAIDWNLDAIQNGQKLPEIIDATSDNSIVVNQVNVNYKPAYYSDFANGFPKMETAWEPTDDSVVLRASALVKDLRVADTAFWISYDEATLWTYTGMVDIEGESIKFNGKEYAWNGTDNILHYDIVHSLDEQKALDAKSNPSLAWSNKCTGKMIIDSRGVNGTVASDHFIRPSTYTGTVTSYENNKFIPINGGQGMTVNNGHLTISPPIALGQHDYFKIQPEAVIDSTNTTYGFRFRFPAQQLTGNNWTVGGIFIAGDWGDTGYYLEFSTTDHVENIEQRTWRNEIAMMRMLGDQPVNPWPGENSASEGVKGYKAAIILDQWYNVDVKHSISANGDAKVSVYLDGVYIGTWDVPAAGRPGDQGKFGAFIRYQCRMDIEYLYAVHSDPSADIAIDSSTFLNIVDGGYSSGYIERQWRYGPQYVTTNVGPAHEGSYWFTALNNRASFFLDEYGPVAHEMREITAAFADDKIPVSHSYLYISNDSKAVCTNYWADPFRAVFTIVNTSREPAILKGDDDSLGPNNTIHQQMFIYGRSLYQDNDATVTKSDDQSIRTNGIINLDIDSRFVETDAAANDIGQWVVDQWAGSSDEVTANIFGNPLLQIGDLVTINYPVRGYYPSTHRYWVVALDNSYSQGLETKLILRRANIS